MDLRGRPLWLVTQDLERGGRRRLPEGPQMPRGKDLGGGRRQESGNERERENRQLLLYQFVVDFFFANGNPFRSQRKPFLGKQSP